MSPGRPRRAVIDAINSVHLAHGYSFSPRSLQPETSPLLRVGPQVRGQPGSQPYTILAGGKNTAAGRGDNWTDMYNNEKCCISIRSRLLHCTVSVRSCITGRPGTSPRLGTQVCSLIELLRHIARLVGRWLARE